MNKKFASILIFFLCVPFFFAVAWASGEDTVRVGLYYSGGSNGALLSANLENYQDTGKGYTFGYYDSSDCFVSLGTTAETQISISEDVNLTVNSDGSYSAGASEDGIGCYHLQKNGTYGSYDLASAAAAALKGTYGTAFPAYESGAFVVRLGSYTTHAEAQAVLAQTGADAFVTSGTSTTVTVTITGTSQILFEYDGGGDTFLAIEPRAYSSTNPQTWFKGYRYYGGFEYDRSSSLSGGKINVINVVDMEDYTRCVIPYEMSSSWPAEALKAQAVCARTYALNQSKHDSLNFDVCSTTNCQVYRGASACKDSTDEAVAATDGLALYYNGKIIEADYYSSNGGASENSENVWTTALPYLRGKQDPYESTITIPNYTYEKTYTAAELTSLLQKKGYSIGTVSTVQPVYTELGNIYSITFTDADGKSVTVKKESCRYLFSASSMHFTITTETGSTTTSSATTASGSNDAVYYVNGQGSTVSASGGFYAISGDGSLSKLTGGTFYARSSSGTAALNGGKAENSTTVSSTVLSGDTYVVKGSGSGHNVGFSQYGANAMAKQGYSYREILTFYYTGVTIE